MAQVQNSWVGSLASRFERTPHDSKLTSVGNGERSQFCYWL